MAKKKNQEMEVIAAVQVTSNEVVNEIVTAVKTTEVEESTETPETVETVEVTEVVGLLPNVSMVKRIKPEILLDRTKTGFFGDLSSKQKAFVKKLIEVFYENPFLKEEETEVVFGLPTVKTKGFVSRHHRTNELIFDKGMTVEQLELLYQVAEMPDFKSQAQRTALYYRDCLKKVEAGTARREAQEKFKAFKNRLTYTVNDVFKFEDWE